MPLFLGYQNKLDFIAAILIRSINEDWKPQSRVPKMLCWNLLKKTWKIPTSRYLGELRDAKLGYIVVGITLFGFYIWAAIWLLTSINNWNWVSLDSQNVRFFYTYQWPYAAKWMSPPTYENPNRIPRLVDPFVHAKFILLEGFC